MAWIGASLNQRMHCQLLMDTSVFSILPFHHYARRKGVHNLTNGLYTCPNAVGVTQSISGAMDDIICSSWTVQLSLVHLLSFTGSILYGRLGVRIGFPW